VNVALLPAEAAVFQTEVISHRFKQFLLGVVAQLPVEISAIIGVSCTSKAVSEGYVEIASLLIASGANVNARNDKGMSPLQIAAVKSRIDVVSLLLENGAAINASDNEGRTSLHNAATNGDSEIVELLLKKGANSETKDKYGQTPLQKAIDYHHIQCAKLLQPVSDEELEKATVSTDESIKCPHCGKGLSGSSHFMVMNAMANKEMLDFKITCPFCGRDITKKDLALTIKDEQLSAPNKQEPDSSSAKKNWWQFWK
jgi:hypothetical protein